jgi:hypothetical protein
MIVQRLSDDRTVSSPQIGTRSKKVLGPQTAWRPDAGHNGAWGGGAALSKKKARDSGVDDEAPTDRGLARQSLEAPPHLVQAFRQVCAMEGTGGVKAVGAGLIALLLGMPEHVRDPFLFWADVMVRRSPQDMDGKDAWRVVEAAINRGPGSGPISPETILDMLLDTERPARDASPDTDRPPTKRAG